VELFEIKKVSHKLIIRHAFKTTKEVSSNLILFGGLSRKEPVRNRAKLNNEPFL